MQYRSRYYDTGQGRFLSHDVFRGSAGSPPSLHRFVYLFNAPINAVDPSGHAPSDFLPLNAFFGLLALVSVLGMIAAEAAAIMDNNAMATQELASIVGYFSSFVGIANALLYMEGASGALVAMGFSVISAASVAPILFVPSDYTRCEVDFAMGLLLTGLMMTALWNFFLPNTVLQADAIAGFEYALIAFVNLEVLGFTFWGGAKLADDINRPMAVRLAECNAR
jgi:hypothetical protein